MKRPWRLEYRESPDAPWEAWATYSTQERAEEMAKANWGLWLRFGAWTDCFRVVGP